MSSPVSQFMCLADIVTCMCSLQVAVFLCAFSTVQHKVGQYLNFKPRMSSMTRKKKKELLLRQHQIAFSRGQIELNPANHQSLCHQHQARVKLQLALRLLLLMILQLYHLPPSLPPLVSNSSFLFRCQRLYARCYTALLYFSRYHTVRLKMFYCVCVFVMYYLCEKQYQPIRVQYYIVDDASWVPKLTLLGLQIRLSNALSMTPHYLL